MRSSICLFVLFLAIFSFLNVDTFSKNDFYFSSPKIWKKFNNSSGDEEDYFSDLRNFERKSFAGPSPIIIKAGFR